MYKKNRFVVMVILIVVTIVYISTPPSLAGVSDVNVTIDGQTLILTPAPMIINGRTLIPLRGVLESLGATVDWNQATRQVIIKRDDDEILLEVDQASLLKNGLIIPLDTTSQIINDRVMIPIRYVAEALGHDVRWDQATRTVSISSETTSQVPSDSTLPQVGSLENLSQLLTYNQNLMNYMNGFLVDDVAIDVTLEEAAKDFQDNTVTPSPSENSSTEALTSESADSSSTNVQTQGVDEGDLVKTNGSTIASLSNKSIHLIDPTKDNINISSTIDLTLGYGSELYLTDNQLIILGSSSNYYPTSALLESSKIMPYYGQQTFVEVYDITDPANPVLDNQWTFDGYLTSSRLIEDDLYMVTQRSSYFLRGEMLTSEQWTVGYQDMITEQQSSIEPEDLYYFPQAIQPSTLLTIGIDLSSSHVDMKAYLGQAQTVYASTDSLYLSFTDYQYLSSSRTDYQPLYETTSVIYQFDLENGVITAGQQTRVPGTINNQFSMDERDGIFRVATTTRPMWFEENRNTGNHLFVMDQDLSLLGSLEDLAPGESIQSIRFTNDRAYMVTYEQIDPFFVIDTRSPENPTVLGALKIPGFSSYLHILDDSHILGFGTDTYDVDGRIQTGGFKLSLFDVTDPSSPIESKTEVIGQAGTYSEVTSNHKALLYNGTKGIMAFPLSVSATPYSTNFVGAYIYDITNNDFDYSGNITHHTADTLSGNGYKYYDYIYQIKRLLTIDDVLYSISQGKIMATNLDGTQIFSSLELSNSSSDLIETEPLYPIVLPVEPDAE